MRQEHLDLDALADLLAGEGTADDVEHVAACADCSATLADLDDALGEVDPLLGALRTGPVPHLPEGFDARLAAGLAGVVPDAPGSLLDPGGAPDGDDRRPDQRDEDPVSHRAARDETADAPLAPVVPLRARPRGAGLLGVAAGAAGLLLAGVLGLAVASGGGSSSETAASGALPATGADEQAGGGTTTDSAAGSAGAARSAGPLVLASGTDYRAEPDAVAALLPGLLRTEYAAGPQTAAQVADPPQAGAPEAAEAAPAPAAEVAPAPVAGTVKDLSAAPDPLARLREPAALQACLEAVASTADGSAPEPAPLALDYASTDGAPALVVVQRAAPGLVEVTAVGPACSADDPARLWSLRLPG